MSVGLPVRLLRLAGRAPSERAREDERLKMEIQASHTASRGTYGSTRIQSDLRELGRALQSRAATRAAVADYIDGFYNVRRRHSLGNLSPMEYELKWRAGELGGFAPTPRAWLGKERSRRDRLSRLNESVHEIGAGPNIRRASERRFPNSPTRGGAERMTSSSRGTNGAPGQVTTIVPSGHSAAGLCACGRIAQESRSFQDSC